MNFVVRSAFCFLVASSALAIQPPCFVVGYQLLRPLPTTPALSLGDDPVVLTMEVELFIPYLYEDPFLPIDEKLSRLRYETMPFSLREPLGARRREESRPFFVQSWVY